MPCQIRFPSLLLALKIKHEFNRVCDRSLCQQCRVDYVNVLTFYFQVLNLEPTDLMSTLPDISPNYKPLPKIDMTSPSRHSGRYMVATDRLCLCLIHITALLIFGTFDPSVEQAGNTLMPLKNGERGYFTTVSVLVTPVNNVTSVCCK